MHMQDSNTGRVPLERFYGQALNGSWQFSESVQNLHDVGALDDSVLGRRSVIIPNYLAGPSNCLAASKLFDLCCPNECVPLFRHIEDAVRAPDAPVEQLLNIVAGLSSSTVVSPRELPESLAARLTEIADQHGGRVHLHSRLFAQWMHHAFPLECSFPRPTLSVKQGGKSGHGNTQQSSSQWEDLVQGTTLTKDLMKQELAKLAHMRKHAQSGNLSMPWLKEDEVFVSIPSNLKHAEPPTGLLRCVALSTLLSSMAISLLWKMVLSWRHPRFIRTCNSKLALAEELHV